MAQQGIVFIDEIGEHHVKDSMQAARSVLLCTCCAKTTDSMCIGLLLTLSHVRLLPLLQTKLPRKARKASL